MQATTVKILEQCFEPAKAQVIAEAVENEISSSRLLTQDDFQRRMDALDHQMLVTNEQFNHRMALSDEKFQRRIDELNHRMALSDEKFERRMEQFDHRMVLMGEKFERRMERFDQRMEQFDHRMTLIEEKFERRFVELKAELLLEIERAKQYMMRWTFSALAGQTALTVGLLTGIMYWLLKR